MENGLKILNSTKLTEIPYSFRHINHKSHNDSTDVSKGN